MAGTLTGLPGLSSVTAAITVSSSTTSATTTTTQASTTQQGAIVSLSGLPIIAGAGIPTITVPYTANAPFMQKSNYPEGTVFIAVGAVLAFLGGCVLLWRGLVAWSINRSVKRAALAALGAEKATSGWTSGRGGAVYKGLGAGSNLSLDALTSSGKPIRSHYKDDQRRESTPPAGLFFSPTARAVSGGNMSSRNSSYLPAGYYASPAAQTGGGANSPILGASVAPYARNSMHQPSPPGSPYLGAQQRNSPHQRRAMSREGLHAMGNTSVRNSYADARLSHVSALHQSHTPSDLLSSNQSNENLGGSRAPSQVFDNFLQGHKPNSRERY